MQSQEYIVNNIWLKLVQTGVQFHCWDTEAFEQSWRSKSGFYKKTMNDTRKAGTREVIDNDVHQVVYNRFQEITLRDHMLIGLLQRNMGIPSWFHSSLTTIPASSVLDAVLVGLRQ